MNNLFNAFNLNNIKSYNIAGYIEETEKPVYKLEFINPLSNGVLQDIATVENNQFIKIPHNSIVVLYKFDKNGVLINS